MDPDTCWDGIEPPKAYPHTFSKYTAGSIGIMCYQYFHYYHYHDHYHDHDHDLLSCLLVIFNNAIVTTMRNDDHDHDISILFCSFCLTILFVSFFILYDYDSWLFILNLLLWCSWYFLRRKLGFRGGPFSKRCGQGGLSRAECFENPPVFPRGIEHLLLRQHKYHHRVMVEFKLHCQRI